MKSFNSLKLLALTTLVIAMMMSTPMSQAQTSAPPTTSTSNLKLQFGTIPTNVEANQTTNLSFSLTNDGNRSLNNLVVSLSKASDRRGGFQQVSNDVIKSIAVNQTINNTISYEDVAGTHTLRLVVIYNNTELTNTAVVSSITILTPPVGDPVTALYGIGIVVGSIVALVVLRPVFSKYIHI